MYADVYEGSAAMKLLADRGIGGISVRLFWDEAAASGADIVLEYEDSNQDVTVLLRPPPDCALDAFYHPNAYMDAAWSHAA